ncbi:YadA-like family protein, partial [Acinetobacter sp. YH12061]|uniref:YadA-like family protein n=4 Tax=Acinetobacter TaxID=469 RepID=UPI0015D1AA0C
DAYYTGPVTEGNHITNKTYVDQQTAAAKTEVAAGTNVKDVVKTQGTNGQDIYTVNAKGTTASAGSDAVTVKAGTPDANNVTDYAVDLSDKTKDSLVKADSALQSIETQIDGVTVKNVNKDDNKVNFVTGDNIVLEDDGTGAIKVSTAQDVTFNQVNTTNLYATGETKLGDSFTVNNGGATYTGPITNGDHITNKTYVDGKTASAKTEVTEGKNISVSSVIGADGQKIYTVATEDEVDFTKVTVGDTSITTNGLEIAGGPSITKDGINAGGKKVTEVADGEISETSKDAVNGSQLYALGNNVTELFGGNATYVNNQISWNNIGGTGQSNIDDAIKYINDQAANANQGWIVATDSGTSAASPVKPGDTVNIKGDSASGVTVSNNGNDITVGLSDQIKVGSGNNAVSIDGNAGTIEVGDVKIDGSTGTITAGQVTVNGDAGTVNGLTNTTWNPDNITSGQAATEDQLKQVAQNAAQVAAAAKSTVTAGDNITVTSTKNDDGSTNYQVATNKDVTFDSVTAGDVNASKVSVGNVTIDQAGINAGGNKVTNVADGAITSTSQDAINGSQLHASNTNIYNYLGGGANYETNTGPTYNVGGGTQHNVGDALDALDQRDNQLDQKITNLGDQLQQSFYTTNKRIDDVEKRAMAGIAAAMSLETAPYVAGKWTYAAAAAHHGGENAVGVTLRKTADNGRWSLTSGIAAASQGDPSFRIGISGVID